jgi:hypothetical protein
MKAIFEFDLPEDQEEHWAATNATKLWLALWDMSNELRRARKNDEEECIGHEFFWDTLESYGITLEELS